MKIKNLIGNRVPMDQPNLPTEPAEISSDEWLTERELFKRTGVGVFHFRRWRSWGLVPKGARSFYGRYKGTGAFPYPPIAVEIIKRLMQLPPRERGNVDACFWALWLSGYSVDIARWTDKRLAAVSKKVAHTAGTDKATRGAVTAKIARMPAAEAGSVRPVWRHLQEQEGRRHLVSWAVTIGVGIEPAISLYAPKSSVAKALTKAAGASHNVPPDPALDLERMSFARLRDILNKAGAPELQQLRSDCKTLDDLVRMAETIDWQKARSALVLPRQGTNEGRRSPIAPFERLVGIWRNFDARAAMLSYLIFVRQLPGYRHELDERLASYAVELQCLAEAAGRVPATAETTT
jgi:hypothetical protein